MLGMSYDLARAVFDNLSPRIGALKAHNVPSFNRAKTLMWKNIVADVCNAYFHLGGLGFKRNARETGMVSFAPVGTEVKIPYFIEMIIWMIENGRVLPDPRYRLIFKSKFRVQGAVTIEKNLPGDGKENVSDSNSYGNVTDIRDAQILFQMRKFDVVNPNSEYADENFMQARMNLMELILLLAKGDPCYFGYPKATYLNRFEGEKERIEKVGNLLGCWSHPNGKIANESREMIEDSIFEDWRKYANACSTLYKEYKDEQRASSTDGKSDKKKATKSSNKEAKGKDTAMTDRKKPARALPAAHKSPTKKKSTKKKQPKRNRVSKRKEEADRKTLDLMTENVLGAETAQSAKPPPRGGDLVDEDSFPVASPTADSNDSPDAISPPERPQEMARSIPTPAGCNLDSVVRSIGDIEKEIGRNYASLSDSSDGHIPSEEEGCMIFTKAIQVILRTAAICNNVNGGITVDTALVDDNVDKVRDWLQHDAKAVAWGNELMSNFLAYTKPSSELRPQIESTFGFMRNGVPCFRAGDGTSALKSPPTVGDEGLLDSSDGVAKSLGAEFDEAKVSCVSLFGDCFLYRANL